MCGVFGSILSDYVEIFEIGPIRKKIKKFPYKVKPESRYFLINFSRFRYAGVIPRPKAKQSRQSDKSEVPDNSKGERKMPEEEKNEEKSQINFGDLVFQSD